MVPPSLHNGTTYTVNRKKGHPMTRNTKVITVATLATLATVATSALGAIIYAVWMMGRHSADPDDWTDDTPPTLNFAAVTVPGVNIDNARWTSPRAIRFPS